MNFESDDEIQAYFNQLNKSAHDLQYAESSSDCISPPSQIPSISEKKVSKPPVQDKFKSMEDKYLKKYAKEEASKVSLSLSQDYCNDEENIKGTTDVDTTDSSDIKSRGSVEDLAVRLGKEPPSINPSDEGGKNVRNEAVNATKVGEGSDNVFPNNKLRRKSSTASLLLTKEGVFYSSSISTDNKVPYKRQNSVIKFSKYVISNDSVSAQSNSIPTEEVESIEEEVSHVASSDHSRKGSKTSQGSKASLTTDNSLRETTRGVRSKASKKSTKESSSSNDTKMPKSSLKNRRDSGGYEWSEKGATLGSDRGKTRREKKTRNTKWRRAERESRSREREASASASASSSSSSELSASSSSSFSVKIKRKKSNRRKRNKEKELTKLICKILYKNLPLFLRESPPTRDAPLNLGLVGRFPQAPLPNNTCGCGSWRVTNSRIDDALRQTVDLTRQFLETHKAFTEVETRHEKSTYRYTFFKR